MIKSAIFFFLGITITALTFEGLAAVTIEAAKPWKAKIIYFNLDRHPPATYSSVCQMGNQPVDGSDLFYRRDEINHSRCWEPA